MVSYLVALPFLESLKHDVLLKWLLNFNKRLDGEKKTPRGNGNGNRNGKQNKYRPHTQIRMFVGHLLHPENSAGMALLVKVVLQGTGSHSRVRN